MINQQKLKSSKKKTRLIYSHLFHFFLFKKLIEVLIMSTFVSFKKKKLRKENIEKGLNQNGERRKDF
jgi:hypothetical protein